MKKRKMTIEDLAFMIQNQFIEIQRQFTGIQEQFNGIQEQFVGIQGQFKEVNKRLDTIEYLIFVDYHSKIQLLESRVLRLEDGRKP